MGQSRRQSTNCDAAHEYSDARADGSADHAENGCLGEHVADDGGAATADRAQHRDDRPPLGDRHGHGGVDQECADHQCDHNAHQGHVVHHLDAVAGPGGPHARGCDDGTAVHGVGDRGANSGKVSARFRGDQDRVELALPAGDVLRQRKRGKDILSAVEIRELLALEHVGDGDRRPSRAGTCRPCGGRPRARPGHRPASADSCSTGRATASFKAPPNSALVLSAPNSRTAPDGVGADIRIIGAAIATPGTVGDVGRDACPGIPRR